MNGFLEKENFVDKPVGGHKDEFYQLKEALYGLTQGSELGTTGLMSIWCSWVSENVLVKLISILNVMKVFVSITVYS